MGGSRKNVQAFPEAVKKLIGDELQLMQFGEIPGSAKALKGMSSGVYELAIRHKREAYRSVVALQLGRSIYVLHAFHKKSKRGDKTPREDLEVIRKRLKEAQELAKND